MEGGNLFDLFKKISSENNLEFAYANSKIKGQTVQSFKTTAPLSTILTRVLDTTKFEFVMVGSIIVVVKNELKGERTLKDSTTNNNKTKSLPIYTSKLKREVSKYELKILEEIYGDEIRKVRSLKKSHYNTDSTTAKPKKLRSVDKWRKSNKNTFFARISYGPSYNKLIFQNNKSFEWVNDLSWKTTVTNSLYGEVTFGIKWNGVVFSAGIGINHFKVNKYLQDTIRKGPPNFPPPPKFEVVNHTMTENYHLITLPLSVGYQFQLKRWLAGIEGGLVLGMIKGEKKSFKELKDYYNKNYLDKFEESKPSSVHYLNGKLLLGYNPFRFVTVAGEFQYFYSLGSLYQNSFYSVKINSICLKGSLVFWFGNF